MSGLDSLYAMLAKPATANIKLTRKVVEASHSSDMEQDSHEAPQSQLPPKLNTPTKSDRRKASNRTYVSAYDRRQNMKKKLATLEGASINVNA